MKGKDKRLSLFQYAIQTKHYYIVIQSKQVGNSYAG